VVEEVVGQAVGLCVGDTVGVSVGLLLGELAGGAEIRAAELGWSQWYSRELESVRNSGWRGSGQAVGLLEGAFVGDTVGVLVGLRLGEW